MLEKEVFTCFLYLYCTSLCITRTHITRTHITRTHITRTHITRTHITRNHITRTHIFRFPHTSLYVTDKRSILGNNALSYNCIYFKPGDLSKSDAEGHCAGAEECYVSTGDGEKLETIPQQPKDSDSEYEVETSGSLLAVAADCTGPSEKKPDSQDCGLAVDVHV